MNNETLTRNELKNILNYDSETGLFMSINSKAPRVKIGIPAGCTFKNNTTGKSYIQIRVKGKLYQSHRLAWLYMTGVLLNRKQPIDHINGDGCENRWSKIRVVTNCENQQNRRLQTNNKSGVLGVSFTKRGWQVSISLSGERIYLGVFQDFFEAVCARKSAESSDGFHMNHGQVRPL